MVNLNEYNFTPIDVNKEIGSERKIITKEMFGEYRWIKTSQIKVDIAVQRELQELHVNKILKKFDPQAFGVLTVSLREDGFYYCSNGQHRLECARLLNLVEVPCIVINNNSIKEEGESFIKINEVSAKVSAIDKYRIGVSSEIPEWLRCKEVLDYAGFKVGTGEGCFKAVSTLYKAINSATLLSSIEKNVAVAKKSLVILKAIVGSKDISNKLFTGMIIFVRHYVMTGLTDTNTVIQRLNKIDSKAIVNKAQDMKENSTRGKVDSYVAYLFLTEYNRGLKAKLPLKIEI